MKDKTMPRHTVLILWIILMILGIVLFARSMSLYGTFSQIDYINANLNTSYETYETYETNYYELIQSYDELVQATIIYNMNHLNSSSNPNFVKYCRDRGYNNITEYIILNNKLKLSCDHKAYYKNITVIRYEECSRYDKWQDCSEYTEKIDYLNNTGFKLEK